MTELQAIEVRCSRRKYDARKLEPEICETLSRLAMQYAQEGNLRIAFVEDASRSFDSMKKSYGMFSGVRSVWALWTERGDEHGKEKAGYYGEKLVLDATRMGLGTCWIGGTFDRSDALYDIGGDHEIIAVISVGYVSEKKSLKEKLISGAVSRKTKAIEQLSETDGELPQWFLNGMWALQKAPTARNSQKVHVKMKQGVVSAHVPDDYVFDLVDLGICKLHFELGAAGRFEQGNGGVFTRLQSVE